jgi:hypothetical protein
MLPYVAGSEAEPREQAVSALLLLSDDPTFALSLHDANGSLPFEQMLVVPAQGRF